MILESTSSCLKHVWMCPSEGENYEKMPCLKILQSWWKQEDYRSKELNISKAQETWRPPGPSSQRHKERGQQQGRKHWLTRSTRVKISSLLAKPSGNNTKPESCQPGSLQPTKHPSETRPGRPCEWHSIERSPLHSPGEVQMAKRVVPRASRRPLANPLDRKLNISTGIFFQC